MAAYKTFNGWSRLLRCILLLIPGVNYIVELIVRWSAAIHRGGILRILLAIISIFGVGLILGWIDFFWVLLTGHLIWAK